MSWQKRISSKSYGFGTFINLAFAIYAGLPEPHLVVFLVYLVASAVLNHYFAVMALSRLVETRTEIDDAPKKIKLFMYLIFKTFFLASGFILLLVYAREKVLQGLLIYIFQLIILGLSIKNIGKFFKKGSPP